MKKYICIIILILIVVNLSFSQDLREIIPQDYQLIETMDFFQLDKVRTSDRKLAFTENDIMGSPFLNDEFIQGTLYTTSKHKYMDLPLRYNAYQDQLEFKTSDGQLKALSKPEIVEKVVFGDYNMVYIPFAYAKKIHHGFFIVLEEGKASLYSRSEIIFNKAEKPAAYQEAQPARFVLKPNAYYIKIGLAEAKKVDRKKELIDVFPDHNNEIETFIKKHKIKASKPENLIKLVKYYNAL